MLELFSDEVLVEEVRAGVKDAALVLWRRYAPESRAAAVAAAGHSPATEQIVRSGFALVVREIRNGADPPVPFDDYLLTAVRAEARRTQITGTVPPRGRGGLVGTAAITAPGSAAEPRTAEPFDLAR